MNEEDQEASWKGRKEGKKKQGKEKERKQRRREVVLLLLLLLQLILLPSPLRLILFLHIFLYYAQTPREQTDEIVLTNWALQCGKRTWGFLFKVYIRKKISHPPWNN